MGMPNFRVHGFAATSWWGDTAPANAVTDVATMYGVSVAFTVPGRVNGFRFYTNPSDPLAKVIWMYEAASPFVGHRAAIMPNTRSHPSAAWQQVWFRPWFRIVPNTDYIVLAIVQSGLYYRTNGGLTSAVTHNGIKFFNAVRGTKIDGSDVTLPTDAPGIDVLFQAD